jgi:hypothetical protein
LATVNGRKDVGQHNPSNMSSTGEITFWCISRFIIMFNMIYTELYSNSGGSTVPDQGGPQERKLQYMLHSAYYSTAAVLNGLFSEISGLDPPLYPKIKVLQYHLPVKLQGSL